MEEVKKTHNYTQKEAMLLEHFFTNLDKNIYCIKNMPEEVWATFMGSYSRTHLHMRDNFLAKVRKGLKESLKEQGLEYDDPLEIISDTEMIQKGVHGLDYLMKAAGKFLGTWAITYGHNSLKDSATFRAAIEDISIIASKEIEWSRLAAYQETSTRYMDFSTQEFYFDPILKASSFAERIQETFDGLRTFYIKAFKEVLEHIQKNHKAPITPTMSLSEKMKIMRAWDNSCNAKAFDTVRYILPAAVLTKLGMTCSTREAEHSIKKYLSSPLFEVQQIGAALLEEGKKVFPTLLKHAKKNDYMISYLEDMHLLSKILLAEMEPDHKPKVSLVHHNEDLEERLIASVLYPHLHLPFEQILAEVNSYSDERKQGILEAALKERDKHEGIPREFEEGILEWDVLMDYGGFRDVQRHRIGTQSKQLLSTHHGFELPKLLKEVRLDDECLNIMENVHRLYKEISKVHPYEAQYIVPLGFKIRDRIIFNPRQTAYFIELRSGVNGHESYRELALMMHSILKEVAPNFAKQIRACYDNVNLGRFQEELQSEDKKEKYGL